MLERLGVWAAVEAEAQPVTAMIITDSRTRDVVRPVFLTFATAAEDGEPSAHVVPDGTVVGALRTAAAAAGVILDQRRMRSSTSSPDRQRSPRARAPAAGSRRACWSPPTGLVRGCARSPASARSAGPTANRASWRRWSTSAQHHGRAEEHFLPGGPFAILPLKGKRASLVWTEPTETAERLIAGDPLTFSVELERRFGHRLGAIRTIDAAARLSARPVDGAAVRAVRASRSSATPPTPIHPIAGQGLNLGYRDVAALAETIVEAHRLGLDIGALTVLERYQRWRRFDTMEMGLVTDGLNRLFSNDNPVLRIVRDVGLGLVDRMPRLKDCSSARRRARRRHAAPAARRGDLASPLPRHGSSGRASSGSMIGMPSRIG